IFASLFSNTSIQRVAGLATCVFSIFAKHLYDYYSQVVTRYEGAYTGASHPLWFGVFSAATFHLGPKIYRAMEHDLAWGWTAITALGDYHPGQGGHIILWDLNLVVHFPPGATILLPRALVRYSFVKIRPDETRYTLIQFTPAPIINFSINGGASDVEFAANATREMHEARELDRLGECDPEFLMGMWTHFNDYEEDTHRIWRVPPPPPSHL
ncbi:hypothetical protein B0H16DRAFT_1336722, partial [Mycena metata]